MVVFYANQNMEDIGVFKSFTLDMKISMESGDNDFEVKTPIDGIELDKGYYVYAENTEYGGIVDKKRIDTKNKTKYYDGRTWRGMLESKIIVPATGEDYYVASGDLNDVIDDLITNFGLSALFYTTTEDTGVTITNYQFYRYTDVYSGIIRLLSDQGYKLVIEFDTVAFKCKLSAQPIVDYGDNQEVTSDLYDFDITQVYGTVNHLIGLGSGELKDRMVLHLYADVDGNISTTQTQFGKNEIVDIYDYPNVESLQELEDAMINRFKELIGSDSIKITLNDIDADVGDKLTAYEEITGIQAVQYIQNKIITINDDNIKIQHSAKTIQTTTHGGEIKATKINIDTYYPVGSIYMSVNSTSPAVLFGGTWEQIEDTFLLSAGSTYSAGSTGGEAEHVLSESEMPKHNHNWRYVQSTSSSGNGGLTFSSTGVTAWAYEGTVEDSHYQYIEFRGGNESHNNMPPYLVVYVWKRTA